MDLIKEMQICREYCSEIHKQRQKAGFISLKYPLITATLNRYFLPDFRKIISSECNLIGYMDIQPVEFDFSQIEMVKLDTTKSWWQEKLANERLEHRNKAIRKKHEQNF